MAQGTREVIDRWHDMMSASSHEGLFELLAEDCIFWSPVVHTPQRGRDITHLYLSAASQVFGGDFRYVSEMIDGSEFKVMVRPLKAVNKVHERMMSMLGNLKASTS
jgi:hypothetical protein